MLKIEGIPDESIPVGDAFEITVRDEKSGADAIKVDWKYDKDPIYIVEDLRDNKYVYTVLALKPGITKISARAGCSTVAFFIDIFEWRCREIE